MCDWESCEAKSTEGGAVGILGNRPDTVEHGGETAPRNLLPIDLPAGGSREDVRGKLEGDVEIEGGEPAFRHVGLLQLGHDGIPERLGYFHGDLVAALPHEHDPAECCELAVGHATAHSDRSGDFLDGSFAYVIPLPVQYRLQAAAFGRRATDLRIEFDDEGGVVRVGSVEGERRSARAQSDRNGK